MVDPILSPAVRRAFPMVREQLASLGYTARSVADRIVTAPDYRMGLAAIAPSYVPPNEPTPLDTLIMLLFTGAEVKKKTLEGMLAPEVLNAFAESGIISLEGESAYGNLSVVPYADFFLLCDTFANSRERDYVFCPDVSTNSTTPFIPPASGEPCNRAFDIGTGSGVLALCAARYYKEVLAIDINERALRFAAFTSALNDIHGIDFQLGDVQSLSNVARDMDLIMFNVPPLYFATPFKKFAVALHSPRGEEMIIDAYSSLPGIMTMNGRALIHHQIHTELDDHFEEVLRRAGSEAHFQVIRIKTITLSSRNEFGLSIIRRRSNSSPFVVKLRDWKPPRDIRLIMNTLEILRVQDDSLLSSFPCLFRDVTISKSWAVNESGQIAPSEGQSINGTLEVADGLVELLMQFDGQKPLREILAGIDGFSQDQLGDFLEVIQMLAANGIAYLEKRS
jgi:SAM-dependent methyltransferase